MSLRFKLVILVSQVCQTSSTALCQVVQTLFTPFQHSLTFGQFRVHDLLFGVSMIGVQIERDQPVANGIFLAVPASEVGVGQFHRFHALARGEPRCRGRVTRLMQHVEVAVA